MSEFLDVEVKLENGYSLTAEINFRFQFAIECLNHWLDRYYKNTLHRDIAENKEAIDDLIQEETYFQIELTKYLDILYNAQLISFHKHQDLTERIYSEINLENISKKKEKEKNGK